MKRQFLLLMTTLAVISAAAQGTGIVPTDLLKTIADRNARSLWGDVRPAAPIPYYSIDEQIIAYSFNYAIGMEFPDSALFSVKCEQDAAQIDPNARWQTGSFGNIVMSNNYGRIPTIRHMQSISDEYAYGEKIRQMASVYLQTPDVQLEKIYYRTPLLKYYKYTAGSGVVYVRIFPPSATLSQAEFNQKVVAGYDVDSLIPKCSKASWDVYLNGAPLRDSPLAAVYVPHPEVMEYLDWSYGCSPTAGGMVLGYWDHYSMYTTNNYGNLEKYHFKRWDPLQSGGEYDYNVSTAQYYCCISMSTDSTTGSTDASLIGPGLVNAANSPSCGSYNFTQTTTFYDLGQVPAKWSAQKAQIDADRPWHCGVTDHSMAAVGYEVSAGDSFMIVHNTWNPGNDWWNYGDCYRVTRVYPGGHYGCGVTLEVPYGDPAYSDNVNPYSPGGETWYAGDVYEISWDYESLTGDYVKLLYSLNGGRGPWYFITTNTENDGCYDWPIPSSSTSSNARIRVEVWDGTGMKASDGSWGNFRILSGGTVGLLTNDYKVNTALEPEYYGFASDGYWDAVGVRRNVAGENWNLAMFSSIAFTTELVSSNLASTAPVDFVLVDGNHVSSSTRGIKVERASGTGTAAVEFEGGTEIVYPDMTNGPFSWPSGDVVDMSDIHLAPGTYYFFLDITAGTADLDMALYGSSGSYYMNRVEYMGISASGGAGADETFSVTITTDDWYGLAIWANDGNSATYTLRIEQPGTWKGIVSSSWTNPSNWSADVVPTSTLDIVIPSGTPYVPIIANGVTAYCHDITISSGATLTQVATSYFYVYGDFNSDAGQFTMTGTSYLYFSGGEATSSWDDDNGNDTYTYVRVLKNSVDNTLNMWQDMTVTGNFEVREGTFSIDAQWTLTVTGTGSTAFEVEDGGKLVLNDENLDIAGTIHFFNGSQASVTGGTIHCKGYFDVDANTSYNIAFTGGTLVMEGTGTQFINDLDGGALDLHNLTIDKPSGVCFIGQTDLDVNGTVLISSGTLSCTNGPTPTAAYNIHVGGNWSNSVGTAGFFESTAAVIFDGVGYQYCGTETFNTLVISKAVGTLRIDGGTVTCASYDWTLGGIEVILGHFIANSLADNAIIGNYYLYSGGVIDLYNTAGWIDLKGNLDISGGTFNVHGGTTASYWPFDANASVTMSGGVLDFRDQGIYFYSTPYYSLTSNITGGTIRCVGTISGFRSDFHPTAGKIEMYGTAYAGIYAIPGFAFNDLEINKSATDVSPDGHSLQYLDQLKPGDVLPAASKDKNTDSPVSIFVSAIDNIHLNGSFTITSGAFDAPDSMYVGGNWTNLVGDAGFVEGTGVVDFNGAGSGDITTNETFYTVALDKTYASNEGLEFGTTVNVLYKLYVWDGTIELNDNAVLTTGSNIFISTDAGINANDPGTIRINCGGNWDDLNTTSDIYKGFSAGSYSVVNMNSPVSLGVQIIRETSRFNELYINSGAPYVRPDVSVKLIHAKDVYISSGKLHVSGGKILVDNNMDITGTLQMLDANDSVVVANNLTWEAGSADNITAGKIIVAGDWLFKNGTNAQLGTGNTVYINGTIASLIRCDDANAAFGNLVIDKTAGPSADTYIHASSGDTMRVAGTMTVNAGNQFHIQNRELIVDGTLNIQSTAEADLDYGYLENNAGSFTLNGWLTLDPGTVLVHGTFELASTGKLDIEGGSFTSDAPVAKAWHYIKGIFKLTSGTFHIVNNSIYFTSTAIDSISGGTIISGYAFSATSPGTFQPIGGTVKCTYPGPGANIYCSGGNYFYNLEIEGNMYIQTDIVIQNNLEINSGYLQTSGSNISIGGNWSNNAGPSGFVENTNLVTFTGPNAASIMTNETFYNLTLNKTYSSYQGLRIRTNVTVQVLNDLQINDGTLKLDTLSDLNVDNDLTIANNAGLNAHDDGPIHIEVGGDWTNYNSGYSATFGYDWGDHDVVTFDGNADQVLNAGGDWELFRNLIINKSGGQFQPNDSLKIYGNLDIQAGVWNKFSAGLRHELFGDLTISTGGQWLDATCKLTLTGANYQYLTNNSSSAQHFKYLDINKTASGTPVYLNSNLYTDFSGIFVLQQGVFHLNGFLFSANGNTTINNGGKLRLENGSNFQQLIGTFTVNSGGTLEMTGLPGGGTTFRGNGLSCTCDIMPGATLGAENVNIEQFGPVGLNIHSGATIDPTKPLTNCRFLSGASGGTYLTVDNTQTLTIDGADFETAPGMASNVTKNLNHGHLYFTNYTGPFSGEAHDNDPFNRIDWISTLAATTSANPSHICQGGSSQLHVTPSGGLAPYTYSWSPASGLNSTTISNPVATPASTTTYNVTVYDNFGGSALGTITVTVNPNPVAGAGDDVTIAEGSSTLLDGSASGGTGPYTYSWSPPAGLNDPSFENPEATPATTTTYTLLVTDANGCTATDQVVVTVIPAGGLSISGTVSYDNLAATALSNTSLDLYSDATWLNNTTTNTSGYYSFSGLGSGSYFLWSSSMKPWGGGNATDALLIMRHFVGMSYLTGLRLAAADADGTGFINTVDALTVMKRFVGMVTYFTVGDWIFETPAVEVVASNVTRNIRGLCYGDVNADYAVAKTGSGVRLENEGTVAAAAGREICLPVSVKQPVELGAVSLVLQFPAGCFEITGVEAAQSPSNLVFAVSVLSPGVNALRIAWYGDQPLHLVPGEVLLTLKVRGLSPLSGETGFTPGAESEIAGFEANVLDGVILTMPRLALPQPGMNDLWASAYPNPFSGTTTITYALPETCKVRLTVFNALGKAVAALVADEMQEAGSHSAVFDGNGREEGVYWYRLEAGGAPGQLTATGKIVLSR